ncbi:hypothetical protein FSP39_011993 [Pinctada imbricata]|uniref:EF-hand domain-containing protein n=1 Tax=Pinctada imbricata TaxID=66713 RepID=A0AA89BUL0_PINIB|nr:hypothetical protein FSP39_011993 [Pinctada imbricata]
MEFNVTGPERQDRYHRLLFNRDNLKFLRQAINELLDIFHSVLENDFEYGSYFSHIDILNRLDEVELNHWSDIRKRFIEDDFHGYKNENFTDDEMKDPAKLMLDFINHLCKMKEAISIKIEQKHQELIQAEEKVEEYREKSQDVYQSMIEERQKTSQKLLEAARMQAKLDYTQSLLDEKSEKIAELQRCSTASLWEKEKEKILKDANDNIDDKMKLQKMKHEMTGTCRAPEDVDKLKREIYMKDKDISHLECELYEQQKLFVGMLAGLRTDINILSEKFYDEKSMQRDPQFVTLVKAAEKVFNGASEGNLKQTKMLLPPHYTFHDKDVNLKRVRRLSRVSELPKLIPPIEEVQNRTTISNGNDRLQSSLPVVAENPVIIDPKTGTLNGIIYLKYFSHMSRKFVLDHWTKFKDFDRNGDLSLDLEEVIILLKDLHCDYTVDQIEEAMSEVDRDNNHCLDFYEYLLVVEKINRKTGNAKLFKQGLSKQKNSEVSKTCVLQ